MADEITMAPIPEGAPDHTVTVEPDATPAPEPETQPNVSRETSPAGEGEGAPSGDQQQQTQEDPLAQAREELARRDRELLERQAELRAYQSQLEEYQRLRELARQDPAAAVRQLGVDPLEAAMAATGGEPPDPLKKVQTLEEKLQTLEQQLQQQQQLQAQMQEMARIEGLIRQRVQDYPMLASLAEEGSPVAETLYRRGLDYYQRTGQIPDYTQIAAQAEKEHVQSFLTGLDRLLQVSSQMREEIARRVGAGAGGAHQAPPASQLAQTLRASDGGETASIEERPLTDEERDRLARELAAQLWRDE